jgi:hypothetical protein
MESWRPLKKRDILRATSDVKKIFCLNHPVLLIHKQWGLGLKRYFHRCKISLAYITGPELNPVLGSTFLTSSCHRESKLANFSPPPCHRNKQRSSAACSPTGEASINTQNQFYAVICWLPPTKSMVGGKGWEFNYIVKGNFSKNRSFYRDDKKIWKYGSGSY